MLEKKTDIYADGNIIGIKFISGDEIICKIVGKVNGHLSIRGARTLGMSPEGEVQYVGWPTTIAMDGTVDLMEYEMSIPMQSILTPFRLSDEFLENAKTLFEKNVIIAPPEKKIIV